MDFAVGAVSRFPSKIPMPWSYRWSSENGCHPGIETGHAVASQDFNLILNHSVGYPAIPQHRCERSPTELVFKKHELSRVSLSRKISQIEDPRYAFAFGIRVRNVVKIVRHEEWNRKAVSISRMFEKIRDFQSVQDFMLLPVNQRKTSWPVPMVAIYRVSTVRLPRMIHFSKDLLGPLHPQDQFSWFAYGCAQIRGLDDPCNRR